MEKWFAALAVTIAANGCGFGSEAQPCKTDDQCRSAVKQGGQCEMSTGLCSFSDTSCESGRRYGGLAGDQSGECVGGGVTNPIIDAAIDVPPPPDAQVCFGSGIVRVCLEAPPAQPLMISSTTQIDTSDTGMCARTVSGAETYCVLAATDISLGGTLRGVGPKPLVLIASGTITSTTSGVIDVGSHRNLALGAPQNGAGSDINGACAVGNAPANGGGGGGGSFLGKGGNGGTAAAGGTVAGTAGSPVNAVTALRGGCRGQDGAGDSPGTGGLGGGAVFLIAGTSITIGGVINAAGQGGNGGLANTSGGGGGGSGGMIGFDAPLVNVNAILLASGGGGGEGSRENQTSAGGNGADPTTTDPAAGGSGDNLSGNGGAGSPADIAGMGNNGNAGGVGIGNNRGAGGGGGGGAGIIRATATTVFSKETSPPPSR